MFWLIINRSSGQRDTWVATGPFTTAISAESALIAAMPTCKSGRIVGLPELQRTAPRLCDRLDGTGYGDALRTAMAAARGSVINDYPETRTMPEGVCADYLGDRADPREVLFR